MSRTMFRQTTERAPRPKDASSSSRGVGVAPTRRRPSWVLIGSLLVGLAALLGAWVFAATSDQLSVVVAARDIEPGEVIDASDLRVVEIGASNDLRAIQSSQQDLILGKSARGPIPAGTVLNTGLFADQGDAVPAGMVVVGAALDPGSGTDVGAARWRRGERAGRRERTTTGQAEAAAPPVATLLASGTVWSVEADRVELDGHVGLARGSERDPQGTVAQAAADGLLRLSLVGGR